MVLGRENDLFVHGTSRWSSLTYLPRKPHETVLCRLVKEHGDEFLEHAHQAYDGPLPRYVEKELRSYMRCGDIARGSPVIPVV